MDTASPRLRMSVIGVVVLGCFAALFARLWYLQVMEAPQLESVATVNRTREVAVEAPRGRILDRNGKVIVENQTSLVVNVDRYAMNKMKAPDRDALVSKLAGTFTEFGTPTKVETLDERLADQQYDDLQPVPIATGVTEDLHVYLSEHAVDFPTVSVERESVRKYNYPGVAGNVLGYVGRINAETLESAEPGTDPNGVVKTYQPDSTIGLAGVEASYEQDLRGTPGTKTLEIDAKNRVVGELASQDPQPGSDIQLNIDIDLQVRAEDALRGQLEATRGKQQRDQYGVQTKNAPAGSAVVLDPNNGAVMALATFPTYDPQEFVNGISTERYAQLSDSNGISALIDRSIYGQYAPGSTFKLVTATAALDSGLITERSSWNDTGTYDVGNPPQTFRSTGRNGPIAVSRALTVSSDVFFYWLGDRMDSEGGGTLIQDTATAFGFDAPTGIDLPNEASGYVLTKAEKEALHEQYPDAYPEPTTWYTGDNVQLAIGQAVVVVTPIQLASAYGALANGGTVYQPHVVGQVLRPQSPINVPIGSTAPADLLRANDPVVRSTVDLPPSTRNPIVAGLGQVTRAGTASGSFAGFNQFDFPVLGKTGTAQVTDKADTSVFASYAPIDEPRYAVAAVMEEAGFGSETAAPLVRHLYEYLSGQAPTPYSYVQPATVD